MGVLQPTAERIVTRRLAYVDGDEKSALNSVHSLFEFARETCEENGPACHRFSDLVWTLLNVHVEPLTAQWHKRFVDGSLKEDDRHEFRSVLLELQCTVRYFEQMFLVLALAQQIQTPTDEVAIDPIDVGNLEFTRILFSSSGQIRYLRRHLRGRS